jgi:hypothetical protein
MAVQVSYLRKLPQHFGNSMSQLNTRLIAITVNNEKRQPFYWSYVETIEKVFLSMLRTLIRSPSIAILLTRSWTCLETLPNCN